MFGRYAFRASSPQAAFAQGAKSAFYCNQWFTRRHCARAHTSMVSGFIDDRVSRGDCTLQTQLPQGMSALQLLQIGVGASGTPGIDLSSILGSEATLTAGIGGSNFPLQMSISGHFAVTATLVGRVLPMCSILNHVCLTIPSSTTTKTTRTMNRQKLC